MILFVQLYNDRSGSARVLRATLEAFGGDNLLYTGRGEGLLSGLPVRHKTFWYRRSRFRLLRLLAWLASQLVLFGRLLLDRSVPRDAVVYVNTLLPFGAALYGKLTGRKVVYHLHEISINPAPLRWCLTRLVRITADRVIYVSRAHRKALPIEGVPGRCIYNPLDPGLARQATSAVYRHRRDGFFHVLMIANLRDYKGVPEYLALAGLLQDRSDVRFHLLVNGGGEEEADIAGYLRVTVPGNLQVHRGVNQVGAFYAGASLVVNLSRVDQWVETFGMTVLEAMAFGVPVIVPPAGGPAELVTEGQEGYLVDSRDLDKLESRVRLLAGDPSLCESLSAAARRTAEGFGYERYAEQVRSVLAPLQVPRD